MKVVFKSELSKLLFLASIGKTESEKFRNSRFPSEKKDLFFNLHEINKKTLVHIGRKIAEREINSEVVVDDLLKLDNSELKVYNSVMDHFPATSHGTAYNAAVQGGVKFQFYPS